MVSFVLGILIGAGGGFVFGVMTTAIVIMFWKTEGVDMNEHKVWLDAKQEEGHDTNKDMEVPALRQDQLG